MSSKGNILVVDDEPGLRDFLEIMLNKEGYDVEKAGDGVSGLSKVRQTNFDLIITDMQMPRMSGIDFLREVKKINQELTVVIITAYASHESAIEAMKLGAYDYITKPFKIDEIKLVIKKAIDNKELEVENKRLKKELETKYSFENIIGRSAVIKHVFEMIERVAGLNVNILVTGESGTGKELVARAIHYGGNRRSMHFVPVNCGAIPENLMESELFGYKKGAFTGATADKKGLFAEAHGGSIFLDEIGELPLNMQVKLLRVIEEKSIRPLGSTEPEPSDVRIIAATNRKLEDEVANNNFREDLFYRLNVIVINIPPLRERKEDITPLALHFINKFAQEMNKDVKSITPKALEALENYRFPGNVRELENIIARCVALESSDVIKSESLPQNLFGGDVLDFEPPLSSKIELDKIVENVERRLIERALNKTGGNKTEAAKLLGITLRSLRYRLEKQGYSQEEDQSISEVS